MAGGPANLKHRAPEGRRELAERRVHLLPGRRIELRGAIHGRELRVVESIISLQPQLQEQPLIQFEALYQCVIPVVEAGTPNHGPRGVVNRAYSREGKNAGY